MTVTITEALSEFLLEQKVRLNAPKTIKDYREKVGLWIQSAGENTAITEISRHDMRRYIASLQERDLARDTIRSYIRALRVYWKFVSEEYAIHNVMQSIKEPIRKKGKPKAIRTEDFIKLFDAIENTHIGIRDRTILCLFADTGARLGGIVSMKVQQVDEIKRRGIVIEKGFEQRTIYWTHYTNQLLGKWLSIRPDCETDNLFVSMQEGRKVNGLTKSGIYQILRRLKKRAGVTGYANPHSFRHNFARQYLLSGGDVVTLAKILGHKDVNMTAEYYAIFDHNELSQLQTEHSPLLKMLELEKIS